MTKKVYILFTLVLLICLSSCVTSRKVNYFQEPSKTIPTYADTIWYQDYCLKKGDRLYIYVYSLDDKMSSLYNSGATNMRQMLRGTNGNSNTDLYTYLVDKDGYISFPTIDTVFVEGKTTREVKHELEKRLAGTHLASGSMSHLSVEVQIVQRFYSVIGVKQSGRFNITREKLTIFEAIAQAGDIADFGDRSKIHIIREQGDSTITKTFDIRSKDIVNSEFYYIEPNDVIYIQQLKGQAFGMNSAGAVLSTVATTLSFGVFIYTLVDRFIINPRQKNSDETTE